MEQTQQPLQTDHPVSAKPRKRIFPKIFWFAIILLLIAIGLLVSRAYSLGSKIFVNRISFFKTVTSLVQPADQVTLQGEAQDQINILLLGYGGQGHDGPYLTDSMILASIKPSTKQILLTSIPRDYYYPSNSGNKINALFADGFAKSNGDYNAAATEAIAGVSSLSNETIPYFAAVDFEGFVSAVDRVGGLDINVERTFTDYAYPNDATNGYLPPQTFTKGLQHMDGARALIFARSRHAEGPEGSDFARSKRQQLVLEAFKQKVLQLKISDSQTISDLLTIAADHFHTNLQPEELLKLAQMVRNDNYTIISQSIDQDSGLVCSQILPVTGEYVLNKCPGITDQTLQTYFATGFQYASFRNEHASIILENSGQNDTYYASVKQDLENAGLTVYVGAYKGIPLTQSELYEITPEPATEQYIEQSMKIAVQPKPPEMTANADLVLIVGDTPQ